MSADLAIAVAQVNPTVGDLRGNVARMRAARAEAAGQGADLVAFPELCVAGYQPEDLVLKPAFLEACRASVEDLARDTADGGPAMLVGAPWVEGDKPYNAALLLEGGRVAAQRFKQDLPNYGVFDDKRVFAAGQPQGPLQFRGARIGVLICEDMWTPDVTETLEERRQSETFCRIHGRTAAAHACTDQHTLAPAENQGIEIAEIRRFQRL